MGPGGSPTPATERFVRYVNRDNTLSASIKSQAVVVESTAHETFEALRRALVDRGLGRGRARLCMGVE